MTALLDHLPWRRAGTGPGRAAGAGFDRRLIAPMVLGSILNPVNSSMIAVALLPIGVALGAPPSQTAWLVSALYLATAIGQPVMGRLVDLRGPRNLFLVGSALVGVAGILGALAPSVGVLVVARVLLGFGTCAGYPAAMYLIRREADRTGRDSPNGMLTLLAISGQTIAVIGPSLGGLLIGVGGWRATFTVNIPLALASLVLGALRLPRTPRPSGGSPTADRRGVAAAIDPAGIALFAGALVSLLLFLTAPRLSHGYLLAVTALCAAGLGWWELRAPNPFLDLRVLGGNPALLASYARTLLSAVVSYSFLYGYTQWIQHERGLSPTVTGLVLMPMFAGGIVVSAVTGRSGAVRGKLTVGALGQLLACGAVLLLGPAGPVWPLIAVALVLGVPQGLNNLANQNAVFRQADPARTASSAGLYRTFFYLGAISAGAANGVFLDRGADTAGLHHLTLFTGGCAAALLVLTLVDRSLGRLAASGDAEPATPPPRA